MAKNKLRTVEDLKGLTECPSLILIDFKLNEIEANDNICKVFGKLPNLATIFLA